MSLKSEVVPDTFPQDFSLAHPSPSFPLLEDTELEKQPSESTYPIIPLVIFMVGFSEGLTHLATLAIYYLFKDDLGLSPAQVSLLFVAPAFPWFLKPLFAFYSDCCPVFGMRRKPYLLFFSFFQALGFVLLAYGVHGVIGAVLSLFIIAFSASFCSAIAEALLVEQSEGQREGASNSVSDFTIAKGIGSLLVAYFSGYLLETMSKQTVFLITAVFPLTIFFTCLPMKESSKMLCRNPAEQFIQLGNFLRQKLIWGPVIFVLVFMSGPDYDDALFFYYTDVLDFKPSFMGTLRFTYGIAAIAGTIFYRRSLYAASYRKILWASILFSLPIYLFTTVDFKRVSDHELMTLYIFVAPILLVTGINLKLGISNQLFVLSGGFLNEAIAEIQLLPLLVLTACICPPGLEGSAYSSMLAVRNLGSAFSKTSSAIFMLILGIDGTHFKHLVAYIFICGCFNLCPFFFLSGIPSDEELEEVRPKHRTLAGSAGVLNAIPPCVPTRPEGSFSFDRVS